MQFTTKFASLLVLATLACASPVSRRTDPVTGAVSSAEGLALSLIQELSKIPIVGSVVEGAEGAVGDLDTILEDALPRLRFTRGLGVEAPVDGLVSTVESLPVAGDIVKGVASTANSVESELGNVPGVDGLLSTVNSLISRRGLGVEEPVDDVLSSVESLPLVGNVVKGVASTANGVESTLDEVPGVDAALTAVNSLISRRGLGVEEPVDGVVSDVENVPVVGDVVKGVASTLNGVESELDNVPGVDGLLSTVNSLISRGLGLEAPVDGVLSDVENVPVAGDVVKGVASTLNAVESELGNISGVDGLLSTVNSLISRRDLGVEEPVDDALVSVESLPVVGDVVKGVASTLNGVETTLDNVPGVDAALSAVNSIISRRGLGLAEPANTVLDTTESLPVVGSLVGSAVSTVGSVESAVEGAVPASGSLLSLANSAIEKRGLGLEAPVDSTLATVESAVPGASTVVDFAGGVLNTVEGAASSIPGINDVLGEVNSVIS